MRPHEAITVLFASKTKLNQTKWNKLMFFTDAAALCVYNKTFTDFKYVKLPYGPAPDGYRKTIQEMKDNNLINVSMNIDITDSLRKISIEKASSHSNNVEEEAKKLLLKEDPKGVVNKIIETFGEWSSSDLSNFSHMFDAWRKPKLYKKINLETLKNDTFLKKRYQEPNFGKLLLGE